ncbi:sugar kinase [Acrocarpospora phusangensis]|uniref:Sugar kinase n=1 Tax=Acrocarpospora phusangensis TaxID=1070424 RepID=A0A919QAA2_9ACTN|nr:sugar kinase [Acrocarpospora phusangensis]GIH24069.1 sugar kinase [Acrocarpospora phusangensis]
MGLLVIGDVVTDVVALHHAPMRGGTDTEADIVLRPGGSGANTAAWAAHLGADARLLARAGFDTAEWHLAELVRAGVRPHVTVDPDHPTAVVIAMVDASGERSFLTNRGASRRLGPADWSDDLLDGVRHLHVSAYTMFATPGLELVRLAILAATGRGVTISVDPASTGFLRDFGVARFLRETAEASIVIPNRDEALLLTGETEPAAAAAILSDRYGTAAVKLGSSGAILAEHGGIVSRATSRRLGAPGSAVTPTVDSTGAGDAFAAGFLAARLAGFPAPESVEAGCRAGAEAVGAVGGRPPGHSAPREALPY